MMLSPCCAKENPDVLSLFTSESPMFANGATTAAFAAAVTAVLESRGVSAEEYEASGIAPPSPGIEASAGVSGNLETSVSGSARPSSTPLQEAPPLLEETRVVYTPPKASSPPVRLAPLPPASGWTPNQYHTDLAMAKRNAGQLQVDAAVALTASAASIASLPAVTSAIGVAMVEGAALNTFLYAADNIYSNRPLTTNGFIFAAGSGALVGPVFSGLAAASGGGLAGNYGWRVGQVAIEGPLSAIGSANGW